MNWGNIDQIFRNISYVNKMYVGLLIFTSTSCERQVTIDSSGRNLKIGFDRFYYFSLGVFWPDKAWIVNIDLLINNGDIWLPW